MAQWVKNPPAMQEMWVQSLGQEDPLGEEMATHSNILAWEIPWAREPGGLQFVGSQRDRTQLTHQAHTTVSGASLGKPRQNPSRRDHIPEGIHALQSVLFHQENPPSPGASSTSLSSLGSTWIPRQRTSASSTEPPGSLLPTAPTRVYLPAHLCSTRPFWKFTQFAGPRRI